MVSARLEAARADRPGIGGFLLTRGRPARWQEVLEEHIYEITGIAIGVLRGGPLTGFEVEERLSWANHRETKRQEDKAYLLLGIFNIHMTPVHGEGREQVFVRLRKKIGRSSKHKAALRQSLPFGLRYACRHWIGHAEYGQVSLSGNGPVHNFLLTYCPY